MSSDTTQFDAIIVGSGQSGTPLAKAFAEAGSKVAMIEKTHFGGTCVNDGCTPTKTINSSGRVAHITERSKDYGIHYVGGIQADIVKIRQRKRDIVQSWSEGNKRKLKAAGVDLFKGEASFIDAKTVKVKINQSVGGDEINLTSELIILNVVERPAPQSIPGLESLDSSHILNSTSIMELGDIPKHLVVLGGGYVGLEFGQLFRRLGAEVTIIQRAKQLLPREDSDIAECLLEILTEGGITVHLSSTVTSISSFEDEGMHMRVEVQTLSGSISIPSTKILVAAGRIPNTENLNLGAVGVQRTPEGHIIVDKTLATTTPGIYAMGDCHGGPAFTHISYDDFRILRENHLTKFVPQTTPKMNSTSVSASRNWVPYVVYTDPQLGHIGLHPHQVKGRKIKTAKMPMSYVARAIETDETRGLMKATVDADTGEILGFTCLGIEGGEIMAVVQAAMMGGIKWWDLEAAVWAHPSLAESLNNLWAYLE
jgi:pyruvate/2-oxoglutarate dehydrogenase complex dihydrolipoamide dehydrogenase (E3) component